MCIATGEELWIYIYEPETKHQSTEWVFQFNPNARVARLRSPKNKKNYRFFLLEEVRRMISSYNQLF